MQTILRGQNDAFVARFDPASTGAGQLTFSTYLGGTDEDFANDVKVDTAGNVVVCGYTSSDGLTNPSNPDLDEFPVTTTGFQTAHPSPGGWSAFLTQIVVGTGPALSLGYSTFYGATNTYGPSSNPTTIPGDVRANALSLNSGNLATIAGTAIADLPTTWFTLPSSNP